jgi:hypothetical protein
MYSTLVYRAFSGKHSLFGEFAISKIRHSEMSLVEITLLTGLAFSLCTP